MNAPKPRLQKTKEYLDLKVMSNIFETALRDQEGASFRILVALITLCLIILALYSHSMSDIIQKIQDGQVT